MAGRKRKDKERKVEGLLPRFFGSMRGARQDGHRLPTSTTIEKAFVEGPLPERTDLEIADLGGMTFLRFVGETLGIPELVREAEIWMENFISKHRMGRIELRDMVTAKTERELELAKIEAKKEEVQRGRDRGA